MSKSPSGVSRRSSPPECLEAERSLSGLATVDLPIHQRPGGARSRVVGETEPHDALLALDIETVIDAELLPKNWAPERFPKPAWHRIVAISFVEIGIRRESDGRGEIYDMRACRSGGEPGWDEARLLRAFWKFFEAGHYRVVTWNGRSFDVPTILLRSMRHGIATPAWFRRGTRWAGYGHRYAAEWHTDLMEILSDFGASARLTLEEAAALVGAPGKLGDHGANVAALMDAGEIGRVRDYCETDCLNLAILYLRWAHLTGRTRTDAYDGAIRGVASYLKVERADRAHLGRFLDAWHASGPFDPGEVEHAAAGT